MIVLLKKFFEVIMFDTRGKYKQLNFAKYFNY